MPKGKSSRSKIKRFERVEGGNMLNRKAGFSMRQFRQLICVLFLTVGLLLQTSGMALAECFNGCAGMVLYNDSDADPSNDTPSDFTIGGTTGGEITQAPAATVTPVPGQPGQITIQASPGKYTYGVQTICAIVCLDPFSYELHTGFIPGEGTIFPEFNLSGIPQEAIVGLGFLSVTLDLSKIPASQCNVDMGYGAIAEGGKQLFNSNTTPIPVRSSCGGGAPVSDQQQKLDAQSGTESCPSCDQDNSPNLATQTPDPVDLFSGSFFLHDIDLSVPGLLNPVVNRHYSSAFADSDGPFGKGSGFAPYDARLQIEKTANGALVIAPGTELSFFRGDQTKIKFIDAQGTLNFTAPGQTGFADTVISLQKDNQNVMTGATFSNADGMTLLFDADGYLSRMQERHGNAVTVTRNSAHRITRLEDPSTSKGIDFTYDANGHIIQATGLASQTINYTYDDQGRLVTVTDPNGQSTQYAYDDQHRITGVTDRRGTQQVVNTYLPNGYVSKQVHGDGSEILLEYPDATSAKVTDGNGHIREHRFDSHGLVTALRSPLGNEYQTSYSPAMFDNSGGPRTVTSTDPLGRQSVTELNDLNQPVKITDAAGRVTTFTYEPTFHLLSTITDPLGRVTRFTYDAQGNVTAAIDPDGNQSTFTYNPQGQVLSATNALNQTVQYAYSPSHDLVQTTDPLGNKTTMIYDTLSRLTKVTDAKGNSTQYAYDILNRVTDITDALGHVTHFAYDENGNVVSVTDPKGNTSTASYDPMNRLVSATNAKGETSSIQYDGVGNVIASTDAKGQTTHFTRDADDRPTQVQHADGTTYQYSYDNADRLTQVSDGAGTWSFAYDILDRLISESTPQGSLSYTYDLVSRLTGFSSPDTGYAPVQYAYDNLDRLTGITQNGKTYSYNYDVLGRRTSLSRPNGVTTSYAYDAGSRLTSLTHAKGATVLEKETLSYDANGNITRQVKAGGPYGDIAKDYSYDPLNRLTAVNGTGILAASPFKTAGDAQAALQHLKNAQKITNPTARQQQLRNAVKVGAVLPETARWTFDANGNIESKSVLDWASGQYKTRTLTYDEANRLVGMAKPDGVVTLAYDANGNLVSDSTGRTFTWNALDQLTKLQTPNLSAQFEYDPQGRRTRYTKGSTLKTYFYNGLDILSDGSSKFLHGVGIDEPLQADGPMGSQSYLQDHLSSTSQLLDSTTALSKARLDYKSYGKLEGDITNPQPANPFTYTGREDDGTGLMYYRARYYDPELEVFISQDPLGDAQRYVGGNPMGFVDPLGLSGCDPLDHMLLGRQLCGVPGEGSSLGSENLTRTTGTRLDLPNGGWYNGKYFGTPNGLRPAYPSQSVKINPGQQNFLRVSSRYWYNSGKIGRQMGQRGWTDKDINSTLVSPLRTQGCRDLRYARGSDIKIDKGPATKYYSKDGGYVIRNDKTGEIIQINDRTDPDWIDR
jgi:RHS repeat-associated protein